MTGKERPRRHFGFVEWGCVGMGILAVALSLLPFLLAHETGPRQPSCVTHVRALSRAMAMYAQDWDQRLPHVQTWAPALKPYFFQGPFRGDIEFYRCPLDRRTWLDRGDQVPTVISYAMVPRWSLHHLKPANDLGLMLVLYESGPMGPAYRHNSGMNVGFADGHSKWLSRVQFPPERILTGQ